MEKTKNKRIILIDCYTAFTSVALLENGVLAEMSFEHREAKALSGNVYNGKVTNILNGLQSAFVDIGGGETGYWEICDVLDNKSILRSSSALPNDRIIAKEGDRVMVQVTKERLKGKAPKLTSNISIPGHYLVYLYNIDFISVSTKIKDAAKKAELIEVLKSVAPKGRGFIARTSCMNASPADIVKEARLLISIGRRMQESWEESSGVALVHGEGNILYRTVRDMLDESIDAVYCNDKTVANDLKNVVEMYCSFYNGKVEYYCHPQDIMDYFGVQDDIYNIHDRRVKLANGGSLVIDKTEALTAIDVNTGSCPGGRKSREEYVYKNNLFAVEEIVRQIRRRNIGGIIVIDFVDMLEIKHQQDVVDELKKQFALHDRVKTRVLDMTELGLVQVTRNRNGNDFFTVSEDFCPFCSGVGQIRKVDYICRHLKLKIKNEFNDKDVKRVAVHINPYYFKSVLDNNILADDKDILQGNMAYLIADWSLHLNEIYVARLADWETVPDDCGALL